MKTYVTIITKSNLIDSNSSLAQGGIAAVIRPPDNFQRHINDTLNIGRGLSDREAVETLVINGSKQIKWLINQGVTFTRSNGELDLTREGGHSRKRVVHAGDITGYEIQNKLIENVKKNRNIQIYENVIAIDLIIKKGKCIGVKSLDKINSRILEFYPDITILATGGIGQLYSKTSNPLIATGDGVAMAWRAGARLRDLEFVQFHPTILDHGDSPYFLISEAVRGEGGILINSEKEAFMTRYHSMQDLAPRDIVSRAIVEEQNKGQVFIDIRERGKEFIVERFPSIYKECLIRGIKMDEDLIPISPAAHYFCGGVLTDLNAETNLSGLLVLGETACTGVHGANRMASNSLLECLVFSEAASKSIMKDTAGFPECITIDKIDNSIYSDSKNVVQEIMWNKVGINRDLYHLEEAKKEIDRFYKYTERKLEEEISEKNIEIRNQACLARLIARAALTRKESRGTHLLNDYPIRDDTNWLKHIIFEREKKVLVDHKG